MHAQSISDEIAAIDCRGDIASHLQIAAVITLSFPTDGRSWHVLTVAVAFFILMYAFVSLSVD